MRAELPFRYYVRAIVQHQLHLPGVMLAILLLCQPTPLHAQSSSGPAVPNPPPATPQPAPTTADATVAPPSAANPPSQPDAPPPPQPPAVDMPLVHSVIATALEFLGPRTLEPHSSRDFTLWGLGCLTALDPTLTFDSRGANIQLLAGPQPLLSRTAPLRTARMNGPNWRPIFWKRHAPTPQPYTPPSVMICCRRFLMSCSTIWTPTPAT
nr:hypothetical protein [Acetobacter ghanensis]